jgi:hypothetical protein
MVKESSDNLRSINQRSIIMSSSYKTAVSCTKRIYLNKYFLNINLWKTLEVHAAKLLRQCGMDSYGSG